MAILDDLGLTPEIAVSITRYLVASYTGPTVRLEDAGANQADFYPDGLGGIAQGSSLGDAPSVWGTAPFSIVTLYEQSNGRDFDVAVNAGVLVDDVHPAGLWGATGLQMETGTAIDMIANESDSRVISGVVMNNGDITPPGGSVIFFGQSVASLAGLHFDYFDELDGTPANKIRGKVVGDSGAPIAVGADLVAEGNTVVFQALKPHAGTSSDVNAWTVDDIELYTEDALDAQVLVADGARWDFRVFDWTIRTQIADADEDFVFFEGVVLRSSSDISDATRSALAQDQMAYYETRDYVPGSGGTNLTTSQERSTAIALSLATAKTIGAAAEVDVSIALSKGLATDLGIATETAVALPLTTKTARTLLTALEADAAGDLALAVAKALGGAAETDQAAALDTSEALTLQPATEVNRALTLLAGLFLGTATDNETAIPLSTATIRTLGLVSEAENALPITLAAAKTLGIAGDEEAALVLSRPTIKTLLAAAAVDFAVMLSRGTALNLSTAVEEDAAASMSLASALTIVTAAESSDAILLSRPTLKSLGLASEQNLAIPLSSTEHLGPYTKIQRAIDLRLAQYQDENVAWENFSYEPKTGTPYLKPFLLPAEPNVLTVGVKPFLQNTGIYQISVVHPIGEGKAAAVKQADELVTHFKRGTVLSLGSLTVRIDRCWHGSPQKSEAWYVVPVSFIWRAETQESAFPISYNLGASETVGGNYETIQRALDSVLFQYQSENVAWENVQYEPTTGTPYLEPYFNPNEPTQAERNAGAANRITGTYEIMVYGPHGPGKKAVIEKADAIINKFRAGSTIKLDGRAIRIERAWQATAVPMEAWIQVPVTIFWRVDTPNQ